MAVVCAHYLAVLFIQHHMIILVGYKALFFGHSLWHSYTVLYKCVYEQRVVMDMRQYYLGMYQVALCGDCCLNINCIIYVFMF